MVIRVDDLTTFEENVAADKTFYLVKGKHVAICDIS